MEPIMRMKNIFYIVISIAFGLFAAETGNAATIIASSCSQADVQSAINRAASGDKVNIPPGNCTWSSAVSIPVTKRITLQGAGKTSTIITSNITSGYTIYMGYSQSRVTGVGIDIMNAAGGIDVKGYGWRVDNCRFVNLTANNMNAVHPNGGSLGDRVYGLIDHCEFENARILVQADLRLLAHSIWARELELGTDKAVYIEDCIFTYTQFGNCTDSEYGGAYVFRNNVVNDTTLEAHSIQGTNRAARKWEIYNNSFNQVSRSMWSPIFLRGGTGVVFNNTFNGSWSLPQIALDNVRSCTNAGTPGLCDGTSPWDGNIPGGSGYPCRDQIGRSTDQYLWTTGTPYPTQALDPAYSWNNRHGSNAVNFFQHNCALSQAHIQPNRDYYNNIEKPGYTPYTYPHPLITTWGTGIAAPRNFRLSAN